ncbi:Protease B inhibitor 2 [Nakaseomyces bracarensis]|uniref:Protease B inhibitor 2 n=1 Tax=Nakaseomyces bracarensis TaxID=273131 RepID=A0ABR4NME8_9SACH
MGKSFIVTLKKSVPENEVKEFIDSVNGVGGQIVHEFSLIKGYTIKMPEKLSMSSFKSEHNNVIETVEEDKEVHAN